MRRTRSAVVRTAVSAAVSAAVRATTSTAVVALALALAACSTLTTEDRQVASAYVENAAQYYDAGHYLRAYQQWDKALGIDPDEERAQLGQAMALYQLSREDSKEGLARLTEAERRLQVLRDAELGDQSWKVELAFALVQERWAELYERAIRVHELRVSQGQKVDPAKLTEAQEALPGRIAAAEKSLRRVLGDSRTEPNFQMTAWLGMARMTSLRGAYVESLAWCRKYETQVVQSREFWEKQGDTYATRLFGARLQEAELRDVLANTLFKLERFDEAEKELDRLIAIQPQRANAYLNRGRLREAHNSWDLARSDYGKFLELTDLPENDPVVLEAGKRRILCEERLAAELERMEDDLSVPR